MKTAHLLRTLALGAICAVAGISASAQNQASLRVFFVDVEGGQATLFVTPTGQTLLIDTGWPGFDSRDAKRIAAVAKQAGVTRLDYVLLTHYHVDHTGGVPQLVALLPVGTFIDHGPNRETSDPATAGVYAAYQKVLAGGGYKHLVAKPGDVLPITGITATVISADGALLQTPMPGAGSANPYCKAATPQPADTTENARSLGIQITFGKLKLLDLGDLTQDKELELMCPTDKLGPQDVYIVSHHGWKQSSNAALVDALHARIAIMDNGETKGGSTPVLDTVRHAPGLTALYQLHASKEGGAQHNTDAKFIANPLGPDAAYSLQLTGKTDGSFDVRNTRTNAVDHYGVVR